MKPLTVFLVQLPEPEKTIAMEAAGRVFPDAQFIVAESAAEAMKHRSTGSRELLVFAPADDATLDPSADGPDPCDLPRWAVVALGRVDSELMESVPPEEWNVPLLSHVMRSAVHHAELVRENARLRGDLKTVARRICHDLRTPLGCIHTSCELLKEVADQDPGMTTSMLGIIRDSTHEITQLIDRVSYVIRVSVDGTPCESVPMGGVVDSVLHELEPLIAQSGAVVRRPRAWPEVIGAPDALGTVWGNLISNALKHRWPEAPIQLDWTQEGDDLRFSVAAQGAPVSDCQRPRLFQPFELLHSQVAPGLGLSFVQRLVSLHGGQCGYERREGDVSVFYFTLPATWSGVRDRACGAFAAAC